MPLLLRYFAPGRAALWAKANDPNLWRSGNFPFELLYDLHDPRGGLSFYEVSTRRDPNIKRIAAALNFPEKTVKDNIESMEFRFIKVDRLRTLGLSIARTAGETKDQFVNSLHREVTGLDGPIAIKLARLMCFSDSVAFAAKSVASQISRHIRAGILPHPSHNMLKNLIKEQAAKVQFV